MGSVPRIGTLMSLLSVVRGPSMLVTSGALTESLQKSACHIFQSDKQKVGQLQWEVAVRHPRVDAPCAVESEGMRLRAVATIWAV